MMKKNKKALTQDFLVYALIIFIFAIGIFVALKVFTSLDNNYQASDASTVSKNLMQDNKDRFATIFDYLFLTVFVILVLVILVGVFTLNTHPAFYFIAVILLAFSLIPIAIIGNSFEDFAGSGSIAATAMQFSIINFIFSKYALMFGALGFIGLAVLYTKFKSGY